MHCRLEWGVEGARRAATRGDAIVIVDTLSFSTGVTAAIAAGAEVYPIADIDHAKDFADSLKAEMAVKRKDVPSKGRFSLSPETLQRAEPGTKIVLPSPNGARCSLACQGSPFVCAGAIVNAAAVAKRVAGDCEAEGFDLTLIACGEASDPYQPHTSIRFALEDLLGVGAIASHLTCSKAPEVRAAEAAFDAALPNLLQELLACESGHELTEMGYPQDVEFASGYNSLEVVAGFDGQKFSKLA